MIDVNNQTDLTFSLSHLEDIASTLTSQEIELIIVSNTTMQEINLHHREIEKPTDVLSFPIETPFSHSTGVDMPLGSIVISATFVQQQSEALHHTIQEELSLLFIHGLLHLLGFDHETDSGQMREKEREMIQTFNLPTSLIVRTHP